MKHVFIVNPAAGKTDSIRHIEQMAAALRERHGLDASCLLTAAPGHATQLSRALAEAGGALRIYACGGDGTANEVANGIAGCANAAMTVVPIGTGNDLLKNFGAAAEQFRDAENLWNGEEHTLDLIDCNGRQCLTIACSGLDARVARDVHRYSALPLLGGKASYVAALAANFLFRSISSRWTLSLDGVELPERDFAVVAVCNGRYYGGGFLPVAEASMTDGVLNTLIVRKVSRVGFLRFVGDYSRGGYAKFPQFASCVTASVIRIRSERADVVTCLDGECFTGDDVTLRLSDRKLRFFAPAGASPDATLRPIEEKT
ncbi:MAG: BmrU protein [Oscillospiraceae bacterium]|nr:BmrU protein [Oscillospiraceae bacterium]